MSRERPSRRPVVRSSVPIAPGPRHPGQVHRQSSRRCLVAEQHVGQRRARLRAGVPGEQHRVGQLQHRTQLQRPPGHHHDHQRLAEHRQLAQQFELPDREIGGRQAPVLATAAGVLADEGDRQVGGVGVAERSGRRTGRRTPPGCPAPRRSASAAAGLTAVRTGSSAGEHPGAQQRVDVVDERAAQVHDARRCCAAAGSRCSSAAPSTRPAACRASSGAGVGAAAPDRRRPRRLAARLVEQSGPELQPEHPAHGVVEQVDARSPRRRPGPAGARGRRPDTMSTSTPASMACRAASRRSAATP